MPRKTFNVLQCFIVAVDIVMELITTALQFYLVFNLNFDSYGSFIMSVFFTVVNFGISVYEIIRLNDLSHFLDDEVKKM